jgi:hypothetical protein
LRRGDSERVAASGRDWYELLNFAAIVLFAAGELHEKGAAGGAQKETDSRRVGSSVYFPSDGFGLGQRALCEAAF